MKSVLIAISLICLTTASLPDCKDCYAPSSGQCKSSAGVCYPADGDVCPAGTTACGSAIMYACEDQKCVVSSTGTYTSKNDCENNCGPKYACTNKKCAISATGEYNTLEACETGCQLEGKVVGLYYADWAKYRKSPYKYNAENLASIVSTVTHLYYGFSFFRPPSDQPQPYWAQTDCSGKQPFTVTTIDPSDGKNIATMVGYKQQNPNLKVIAALGGWTFPSSFFSAAFSTAENRKTFIASIKEFTQKYKFDGINLDWEYPCSQPRTDTVKITCQDMKTVKDNGGDCPGKQFERGYCSGQCADGDNLVSFLKELKADQPDIIVSIAQSASPVAIGTLNITAIDEHLDHWNLMNYDFFVSDIKSQKVTAPNQNLHTVESLGVKDWSAADAIRILLAAGATPKKVVFGVAYYGHTYYVPGLTGDAWKKFNIPAQIQGDCCGAFKETYGGKPGKGSQQCGTYMFSEIEAAGFQTYFDNSTQSMIGYLADEGKDNYTPAGTWISYLNKDTVKAQVEYAMGLGLGGAFAWDCTMDTISNGEFTYELTHQMASSVAGSSFYDLE